MLSRRVLLRRQSRDVFVRALSSSSRNLKGISIGGIPSASSSPSPSVSRSSFASLKGQVEQARPPPPSPLPPPSIDDAVAEQSKSPMEGFVNQGALSYDSFRRRKSGEQANERNQPIEVHAAARGSQRSEPFVPPPTSPPKFSFANLNSRLHQSTADAMEEDRKKSAQRRWPVHQDDGTAVDAVTVDVRKPSSDVRRHTDNNRKESTSREQGNEQGNESLPSDGWGPGLREKIGKARERESRLRDGEVQSRRRGHHQRQGVQIEDMESSESEFDARVRNVCDPGRWQPASTAFAHIKGERCRKSGLEGWTVFAKKGEDGTVIDTLLGRRFAAKKQIAGLQILASVTNTIMVTQPARHLSFTEHTLESQVKGGYLQVELGGKGRSRTEALHDSPFVGMVKSDLSLARKIDAIVSMHQDLEEQMFGLEKQRKRQEEPSIARDPNEQQRNPQSSMNRGTRLESGQRSSDSTRSGNNNSIAQLLASRESGKTGRIEDRTPIPHLSAKPTADNSSASRYSTVDRLDARLDGEGRRGRFEGIEDLFSPSTSYSLDESTPVHIDGNQAMNQSTVQRRARSTHSIKERTGGRKEGAGETMDKFYSRSSDQSSNAVDDSTPVHVDGRQARGASRAPEEKVGDHESGAASSIGDIVEQSPAPRQEAGRYTLSDSESTPSQDDSGPSMAEGKRGLLDGAADVFSSSTTHEIDEATPVSIDGEQAQDVVTSEPHSKRHAVELAEGRQQGRDQSGEEGTPTSGAVDDLTPVHVDGEQGSGGTATSNADGPVALAHRRQAEAEEQNEGKRDSTSEIIGSILDGSASQSTSSSAQGVDEATPVNVEGEQVGKKD